MRKNTLFFHRSPLAPGRCKYLNVGAKVAHPTSTHTPTEQQNANDLLSPPPWTSGHVCLNTHLAWSGLLHHNPAFQRTPEVLPQGRRPKQSHTYGTATHTLAMCPRESTSVCASSVGGGCATLCICLAVRPPKTWAQMRANMGVSARCQSVAMQF